MEDGASISPFTIAKAKHPVDVGDIKNYVEVINKLIRRYAFFFDPLVYTFDLPFVSVTSIFYVLLRNLLYHPCFNMSIDGRPLRLTSLLPPLVF